MTNKYKDTGVADHTPAGAILSDAIVVIGNRIGIANADIAASAKGAVVVEGVFELAKETDNAFADGDSLFWDDSADVLTIARTDVYAGVAVGAATAAATTAKVDLNRGNPPVHFHTGEINTETLAADKTIADGDPGLQFLDPGGAARDVDLPAAADNVGACYIIINTADGAEAITVRDDASATVLTLDQDQHGIVFCNGTIWRGFMGGIT